MLRDVDFHIGVVLSRLVRESGQPVNVRTLPQLGTSVICVEGVVALFVKHCSKRLSPWGFTFAGEQWRQLEMARKARLEPIVALVCNDDGIAALTDTETRLLIGDQQSNVAWIKASRDRREAYAVRGSNGALGYKVSPSDLSKKILFAVDGKVVITA